MTLEVFYDYVCPFCLRGHDMLLPLLDEFPQVTVDWRPCEAHPRPECYGRHSDLCACGYYIARDMGVDPLDYHRAIYDAAHTGRIDTEDVDALCGALASLVDPDAFMQVLAEGQYLDELAENNDLAWRIYGFPAVPSFRLDGHLLTSIENVGVTRGALRAFLDEFAGSR